MISPDNFEEDAVDVEYELRFDIGLLLMLHRFRVYFLCYGYVSYEFGLGFTSYVT